MMTELLLPAAFAAGFFGSTHCLAMCGAIVLLFEGQNAQQGGLIRRLTYNSGRMLFYVTLGLFAGASGALLIAGFTQGLMVLRWLAGILLILLGINLAFDWQALRFLELAGAAIWKRLSPLARHVLPIRSLPTALAAGFLWGALPCGLVY
ncbi:MAG: sulfite exporter TauE/SafE family protein, partial [Woeseia sp.]